ncbi:hypothetical protein [Haloglomus halophilum]|uniref:hypothetical protein n=1 Tax=Haloglomus halophilum TaxID=2962672 RepID=UPI0020CA1F47|nr:hypothetical protein [Haloglomus halophilum]
MSVAGRKVVLGAVALVVVMAVVGIGIAAAADKPSATDGDVTNGEELKSAEDDEDQVLDTNYTFVVDNPQPGAEGDARHFAVGLTEEITLHRIKLYSEDIGYSNCEPDNTAAFGIDRGNDDPGTNTDVSLLTSFKSYTSEKNFIDIKYYKEEKLAGGPIQAYVDDQVVAAQNGCYDNPSEPGWYRINGTITGSSNGDTTTDYKVRDLSGYFYVCDCASQQEAESTLGPPPNEDSGGDGGDASTPTATAAATTTATPSGSDDPTATATGTATATVTATASATATTTAAATATATADGDDGGGSTSTNTQTATAASGDGGSANRDTATAARQPAQGDAPDSGAVETPTIGAGPGFGAGAALLGGLVAFLLARR